MYTTEWAGRRQGGRVASINDSLAWGTEAQLASHLPVISWSESFQGIVTIVSCNFVVPQMQLSNKTDGLRRLCNTGPVCCLRLIRSDKNVTIFCVRFCVCCCFLGKKWYKYGCSVLLLSAKQFKNKKVWRLSILFWCEKLMITLLIIVASKFLFSCVALFTSFVGMIYFLTQPTAFHHTAENSFCRSIFITLPSISLNMELLYLFWHQGFIVKN